MKESIRSTTGTLWIITITLIFFSIGCEQENLNSKEFINNARQEIDAAWLSEDTDVIMTHSADDMILMPPNVKFQSGKEEIRNFLQGFFDNFTMTDLKTIDREIKVSGDWAYERGTYEWVIVPEGSIESFNDRVNFIGIWQRQPDGMWKEVRAIWNSTKPLAIPKEQIISKK